MKHTLLSFFLLLTAALSANAQATRMSLGYVNGQMNTSGTDGFSINSKDTWVSGAIYIPADQVRLYANNHIDSIHAGLASRLNVDSLRVWVRTSLTGEDLASGAISGRSGSTPRVAKGWNTIGFDHPYAISDQTEGLYIGYSYHQKGNTVALSVVDTPQSNALFVQLGTEAEWQDRSSEGALAVEAYVYGDQLPKYNLTLTSLDLSRAYIVDNGTIAVSAQVRNNGSETITGFDAVCRVDNLDETYTAHINERIPYGETHQVEFSITPAISSATPSNRKLTVTIDHLTEGADIDMRDNTLSAPFEVVAHDFTRNVLLEEFTTEKCPNCPRVAGFLHKALQDERIAGRAIALCHHSGYYTDWLTIPSDNDYLWFFGGGGSYAPAMMFDRSAMDGENTVCLPQSADEIVLRTMSRLSQTAYVSISINAEVDSNDANLLHVNVEGERLKENFTAHAPRISVVLYEDNIKARSQASGGDNYVHQHVSRCVNSTWGDVIEWDGDAYTYTCDLTLREDYVRDNLGVVAYVWDYDTENPTQCEVANAASITWNKVANNIAAPIQENTTSARFYTLDGREVSEASRTPGIYLVKKGSQVKKVLIK